MVFKFTSKFFKMNSTIGCTSIDFGTQNYNIVLLEQDWIKKKI